MRRPPVALIALALALACGGGSGAAPALGVTTVARPAFPLRTRGVAYKMPETAALPRVNAEPSYAPLPLVGPPRTSRAARIVIDPGHGGKDPGATGRGGLLEKDVALEVAQKLAACLHEKGVQVILTRQTDVFVPIDHRVAMANRERPDLFISIHANSDNVRSLRGARVLYPRDRPRQSRRIHSIEAARLIESALGPVTGCIGKTNGAIGDRRGLELLRETHVPAVLVEVDFLSNRTSERMLATPAYCSAIANAIGGAVTEYLRPQGTPRRSSAAPGVAPFHHGSPPPGRTRSVASASLRPHSEP